MDPEKACQFAIAADYTNKIAWIKLQGKIVDGLFGAGRAFVEGFTDVLQFKHKLNSP